MATAASGRCGRRRRCGRGGGCGGARRAEHQRERRRGVQPSLCSPTGAAARDGATAALGRTATAGALGPRIRAPQRLPAGRGAPVRLAHSHSHCLRLRVPRWAHRHWRVPAAQYPRALAPRCTRRRAPRARAFRGHLALGARFCVPPGGARRRGHARVRDIGHARDGRRGGAGRRVGDACREGSREAHGALTCADRSRERGRGRRRRHGALAAASGPLQLSRRHAARAS
mmetsp:Transcript_7675/g.19575  ORF Transcript_7675/g.19575 Transcript_7675/m.19575 type:complete len:229 (-) Transcript_7675:428-1114(-)